MIKSGSFVARDGKKYSVAFDGESVSRETLTFSVPPVVISMAQGEHKYCGFKSTTATFNLLTSHLMTDLYTERVDGIAVEVYNLTDDVLVFNGYVVPFAYDQPFTGVNDVLTVNAVDLITARKNIPYKNIGEVHGVDLPALEIVQGICERSGITRLEVHNNFNDDADIMATSSPLDVMVAQAGFLQDKMSDADALSAICKFFGYTGHVVGDTLYLYDEYAMLHGITSSNLYALASGLGTTGWVRLKHRAEGSTDALLTRVDVLDSDVVGDAKVSIERAYDGIQITPQGSDVSILLPNVCAKENSSENDNSLGTSTRMYQDVTDKRDYIQYRTPRKSNVMELGVVDGGELKDMWSVFGGDPVVDNNWYQGSMLLDITHMNRKRWKAETGAITIIGHNVVKEGNMIWAKGIFPEGLDTIRAVVGKQKDSTCYSHTGGRVKLSLECILMRWGNWIDINSPDEQDAAEGLAGALRFVVIRCGSKRYDVDQAVASNVWTDNTNVISQFYTDGNSTTLLPIMSNMKGDVAFFVPDDGQIRVDIEWINSPAVIYSTQYGIGWNLYITSLALEGYGDNINTACDGLRHSFSNRPGGEYLTVETALTTRGSDSVNGIGTGINARPGVVSGMWSGYYLGRGSSQIPLSGVMMTQLKDRYSQPQEAFTITVDGHVHPYKRVFYIDAQRDCTIESYDWDIYNNETTITID